MDVKTLSISLVALIAAILAAPGPALSQPPAWVEKIDPELRQVMAADRSLPTIAAGEPIEPIQRRVMIKLATPATLLPTAMDYRTAAGIKAIQDEVEATQESVLAQGVAGSFRTLTRYESLFGFSALADAEAIEALAQRPEVERIEIMPIYYKMSAQSHPLANVDAVHDLGFTGEGVTIAIIDDGIDHDHPAFGGFAGFPNAKIVGGRDFADDDEDPTIDCLDQSHGTAVTGVAAGNGGGITGTAPDADIVFLKVQSELLCGQPALDGDIVGAIDWAVSHRDEFGIRIISMSLGGGGFSDAASCEQSSIFTRDAVDAAVAAGLVVLAASGNDGFCSRISRPACVGSAISVGAVYDAAVGSPGFCVSPDSCDSDFNLSCAPDGLEACFDTGAAADQVTCYSNSAGFLDILAPSNCATTANAGGGTKDCFGGTSSATPFAAGVAAVLIEADGALDSGGMRALLRDHGVDVLDDKSSVTTPRVDAEASLAALDLDTPPTGVIDWNATPTAAYGNQDGDGSTSVADGGATFAMAGNRWRRTEAAFELTPFTVVEFDYRSTSEGEIHGIGFDEDDDVFNGPRVFQLFGTQTWSGAIQAYDGDYAAPGSTVTYRIPVGAFYTGSGFRLVLVNDKDAGAGTNTGFFSNVRVFESVPDAAALDFNAVATEAYSNQDRNGTQTPEDAGATLSLQGNRWRRTAQTFTITSRTMVAFEFQSTSEGEIHGLGFDENQTLDDAARIFRLFGTQSWSGDVDWFRQYQAGEVGSFKTYVIPVGRFYAGGGFHLVLVNDKDAGTPDNTSR
ncbi:MAG: S8 family serine peptidase, partial [Thermoanaerobaculia bacterium]